MSYETIAESVKTLSYEEQINLMSVLVMLIKNKTDENNSPKTFNYKNEYPKGFFDNFASDPDFSIKEPEELSFTFDIKREDL